MPPTSHGVIVERTPVACRSTRVDDAVDCYDRRRLPSSLSYPTPLDYEAARYATPESATRMRAAENVERCHYA